VQQAFIDALSVRLAYLNIQDLSILYPAPVNNTLLPKRNTYTLSTPIYNKLTAYGAVSVVEFDNIVSSDVY
jgi:hypothetical protein